MINFLILILSAENLKSLDKLCKYPVNGNNHEYNIIILNNQWYYL